MTGQQEASKQKIGRHWACSSGSHDFKGTVLKFLAGSFGTGFREVQRVLNGLARPNEIIAPPGQARRWLLRTKFSVNGYVDTEALQIAISPKSITDEDLANLVIRHPNAVDLDPGEKELLAYALRIEGETFLLCSPDKVCVRAAFNLGFIERYVALEDLTKSMGLKLSLKINSTKKWMESVRTGLVLGTL